MNDNHRADQPIEVVPAEESEEKPQPRPTKVPSAVPMVPITRTGKGKEPWKQGSGCGGRVAAYGCAIGVVVLIGVLMAGASLLRRGVWTNMEKGRQAVVRALPVGMPEAERRRTAQNLDRFRRVLEELDDPYPVMGQFMQRVRAGLADGRLTAEEVVEMNLFLEKVIEESGIPPLQLGFRISNFEFRICSSRRGLSLFGDPLASVLHEIVIPREIGTGQVGGNPKSEIRNPKFSPA